MTDTETELETLARLESALAAISAACAVRPQTAEPHTASPAMIATLDQVIATLRTALAEPDIDEGTH